MSDNIVPFPGAPQTAAQVNQPQTGQVILTSDEIRSKITEQFKAFEPHIQSYREYAERVSALAVEYHTRRLAETFPTCPIEELTLAATLDARETPKSLDTKLAELAALPIKRVIFDNVKFTYFLYV